MGSIKKAQKGFTLIEILVVIGIIAILASIVIIAINPARQFAQARNSQRTSNVTTLLNGVGQDIADNKGVFTCGTVTVPATATHIGSGTGFVNLESCLVPTYVPSMVMDPKGGSNADTGYTIDVDAQGRYQVCAPLSVETGVLNLATPICVTR